MKNTAAIVEESRLRGFDLPQELVDRAFFLEGCFCEGQQRIERGTLAVVDALYAALQRMIDNHPSGLCDSQPPDVEQGKEAINFAKKWNCSGCTRPPNG